MTQLHVAAAAFLALATLSAPRTAVAQEPRGESGNLFVRGVVIEKDGRESTELSVFVEDICQTRRETATIVFENTGGKTLRDFGFRLTIGAYTVIRECDRLPEIRPRSVGLIRTRIAHRDELIQKYDALRYVVPGHALTGMGPGAAVREIRVDVLHGAWR
jgi:hypothetical protein